MLIIDARVIFSANIAPRGQRHGPTAPWRLRNVIETARQWRRGLMRAESPKAIAFRAIIKTLLENAKSSSTSLISGQYSAIIAAPSYMKCSSSGARAGGAEIP